MMMRILSVAVLAALFCLFACGGTERDERTGESSGAVDTSTVGVNIDHTPCGRICSPGAM
jgi:hypothetical protein